MENRSTLEQVHLRTMDAEFQQDFRKWSIRWLLLSTALVLALETLLMLALEFFVGINRLVELVLDGLILVLILLPLNYFYIVRPLLRQVEAHRRTNQALTQSNEVLERFFSLNDVLIAYVDTDFNFIRVNKAYAEADQRDPEFFIGKNHFDLYPHDENQAIFELVISSGKNYVAYEKPFQYAGHPERGTSYWDWSLLPVKDPTGQVAGMILALTDVTARKVSQLALAESERRFRAVFNQTFQQSALLDPLGQVEVANQTALDFTGLSQDEVAGRPLWQVPWWDSSASPMAEVETEVQSAVRQAAGGEVARAELRIRSFQEETAIMDITIKPLLDEEQKPVLLIYEARNITGYFRAVEALKRSEDQIKRLYLAEMRAHQFAETLRSANLALSRSLDSDTVLENLLDHLHKVALYTSAHVILMEDVNHLVIRLARGEETWEAESRLLGRQYETSDLVFFKPLIKEHRVMESMDTLLYPGPIFLPDDQHVRCWLAMPLEAGEQVIGICLLEHECPGFFTAELVNWVSALTSQAAFAIQNAWLFEQVRDGREHLQALSRRLVDIQEHERSFIARELHDEAGQALTSIRFGLHLLELNSGDPQQVVAQCQELKKTAEGVLDELHRLSVNLRPAALDHLGLVAALRQHAESVSSQHGLPIQFETIGKIERMPGEVETAIYRILQETLTNIVRHAHAGRVDILLEQRGQRLFLTVEDNGVGFDPQLARIGQLGVLGIRERADMLGGKVDIESTPGKGTTVLLEVPWPSES